MHAPHSYTCERKKNIYLNKLYSLVVTVNRLYKTANNYYNKACSEINSRMYTLLLFPTTILWNSFE